MAVCSNSVGAKIIADMVFRSAAEGIKSLIIEQAKKLNPFPKKTFATRQSDELYEYVYNGKEEKEGIEIVKGDLRKKSLALLPDGLYWCYKAFYKKQPPAYLVWRDREVASQLDYLVYYPQVLAKIDEILKLQA